SSARRTASLTRPSGPSACSDRCAWITRRRCTRCARPRTSSPASSKTSMATTERDYYELLGVSRDADDGAIKKAFRRLARQLHPDVSSEAEAEQRFREVTEAYEVLSNSETRALYDRYGHAGLRSGGFQPTNFDMGGLSDLFAAFFGDDVFGGGGRGRGAQRGADVGAEIAIELAEAARGTSVQGRF